MCPQQRCDLPHTCFSCIIADTKLASVSQFPILYGFDKYAKGEALNGEARITKDEFCQALMPGTMAPIRKRRKDEQEQAEALAAAARQVKSRRKSVVQSISAAASGLFNMTSNGADGPQEGGRRRPSLVAAMLGSDTASGEGDGVVGRRRRPSLVASIANSLVGGASKQPNNPVVV